MSLRISRLELDDFRGYSRFLLEGVGQLVVLVGPNAVGKTNVIEGIQLLTSAESFRKPSWGEVVSWGAPSARLAARFEDGARVVEHRLVVRGNTRSYEVNGKKRNASAVRGTCPSVLFIPDDLQLVKASSARRRAELDSFGAQLSREYARLRADYQQALRQRNLLVRDGVHQGALFESWDEALAVNGARLCANRMRLFSRVASHMEEIYARIVPGEELTCAYLPSWARFDAAGRQLADAPRADLLPEAGEPDVGAAQEELLALSRRLAAVELRRGTSLVGPHKDEAAFFIRGANARLFGSQGQQRTVVLAWKLAEVEVVREITGQRPVLLLDDVMSELDERHRDALTDFVGHAAQTFVTTANLGYFSEPLLSEAEVVRLPVEGTRYAY